LRNLYIHVQIVIVDVEKAFEIVWLGFFQLTPHARLTGLYTLRRLIGGSGYEKPQSALSAFVRFFSATFWLPANATVG
jgi:hypothetical protein